MYPSSRPYPRLLPPVFLSPIEEVDEEGPRHNNTTRTESEDNVAELNNSSVIAREIVNVTSLQEESSSEDTAGARTEKVYIESCSGRKHEDVEVVKQKYINSEIQDLPRIVRGPVRYGHIHRTRSSHLNLGSQDIRSQMNRIRLKSKTNLPQQEYRCKKYTEPSEKCLGPHKSVEEILYGEYYNRDDYDPELAALFENYIEECDNITRNKTEPVKYLSPYPTDCSCKDKESLSEHELQQETEHAFLCGYFEGLKQTGESMETGEAEKCKHPSQWINGAIPFDLNHRDFISSQQDVTHMSLRKWEHDYRHSQQVQEDHRKKLMKSLQAGKGDVEGAVEGEMEPDNDKGERQGDTTVAGDHGKPNENHNDSFNKSTTILNENGHPDHDVSECECEAIEKKTRTHDLRCQHASSAPSCKEISDMKSGNPIERSLGDMFSTEYNTSKPFLDTKSPSFTISREKLLDDMCHDGRCIPPYFNDDEESIVRLAKKKLEHKLMTTKALEDTYLSKLKAKLITNDCKQPNSRKGKIGPKSTKTGISNVEAKGKHIGSHILDELDGWKTKSKTFNDQDNVQLSTSELLHPVDSFESVYSPMWTPSRSTPLFTPADHKMAAFRPSPSPVTPISATLSDLQYKPGVQSKKSINNGLGAPDDYKKAANLVKLRLTKSSSSVGTKNAPFGDKSFVNVPLSQCVSYNVEQNMRSGVQLTTNINLSEKLAQQLKELSTKSRRNELRHLDIASRVVSDQHSWKQSTTTQSDQTFNSDETTENKVHELVKERQKESCCSLPKIRPSDDGEREQNGKSPIPRQKCHGHDGFESNKSESLDLPPLSVRSFPARNSQKASSKIGKAKEDDCSLSNRSLAVRAKVCTSPYTFDKEDPSLLQLEARPLPPLHTVCTSCGGISGGHENKKVDRKQKKPNGKEAEDKSNSMHTRCCGSYMDDKWQLERKKFDQRVDFPSVGVEKLVKADVKVEQTSEETPKPQVFVSQKSNKLQSEEMSIKFMDKNIKFHFQCDVTVDNAEQAEDKTVDTSDEWLNSMSAPNRKDRYKCPVATETRIYKADLRKHCAPQDSTPQTPVSSPYLDYCKYKSTMRAKRNEKLRDRIEFISDTCITEDVNLKSAAKGRHFPVIPMKKCKQNKVMNKCATTTSRTSCSPRKGSEINLLIESTKPAFIPTIKSDPLVYSRENTNNNGHIFDKGFSGIYAFLLTFGLYAA